MTSKSFIEKIKIHCNVQGLMGPLEKLHTIIKNINFNVIYDLPQDTSVNVKQIKKLYIEIKKSLLSVKSTILSPQQKHEITHEWIHKLYVYLKKVMTIKLFVDCDTLEMIKIFDEFNDILTDENKLRVKTVLTYYQTKNIIPDFHVLLKNLNINVDRYNDKIITLQNRYNDKKDNIKNRKETSVNIEPFSETGSYSSSQLLSQVSNRRDRSVSMDTLKNGYIEYEKGIVMRYEVMEPMYESFAEECIMNNKFNITVNRFNEYLYDAKKKCENGLYGLDLVACRSDKNFGIEKHQPMGVEHLLTLIIYVNKEKYARALAKSYLLLNNVDASSVIQSHQSDFYYFGRYLFVAIEFFGDPFDDSCGNLHYGSNDLFIFSCFGQSLNFPRCTTPSVNAALHFAGNQGSVLSLQPKYNSILNNAKYMDLSKISENYANERLFFGTQCSVQIIDIIVNNHKFGLFMAALAYLEKIFLQSIFDYHFTNLKYLYKKRHRMHNTLLKLLNVCKDIQKNKSQDINSKPIIIKRYFQSCKSMLEITYAVDLLLNWCNKKDFITFETLPLEIPYMGEKLKDFFIEQTNNNMGEYSYSIKIENIRELMPNLVYCRDCNKNIIYITNIIDTIDHILLSKI
eukprot:521466_1